MRSLCLCLLAVVLCLPLAAAELQWAATLDDCDMPHCQAFVNGAEAGVAPKAALEVILGLAPAPTRGEDRVAWSTGAGVGRERAFRIAFLQPLALGTLCAPQCSEGTTAPTLPPPAVGNCVSYLKPDAPYPGDVTRDEQWLTLPPGVLKTLPPGVKTRALRFTMRNRGEEHQPSTLDSALLFSERYYSALNIGGIKRSQVKMKPETWMGSWREALTVSGLLLLDFNTDAEVEVLRARATDHPLIAPAADWQHLTRVRYSPLPVLDRFDKPLLTRAVRLRGGTLVWRSQINTVLPLVNLGDTPAIPSLTVPPAPYHIPYAMPMDGFVALDIHDKKSGQRVRRLIAEVERGKGPNLEAWDLKDDAGTPVPPGDYEWRAVTRPPFKLTYEMSVYNAGQPAWWAPPPGKGGGGWLADHGAPYCAAAMGTSVWLGAQCAESGHVLAVTDLDGNKLWGRQYVSWGFSGPDAVAVDKRYGYLVNDALVMRIDPQKNYASQTIWDFKHTAEFPGNGPYAPPGHCGAAVKGDKLYVSFNAKPESWLRPSFLSETMDPSKCMPLIRLQKGNGKRGSKDPSYAESEYDELMRLYAAFLTDTTPAQTPTMPDTFIPSSTQAFFGDAPENGPMAGTLTVVFKKPVPVGSVLLPEGAVAVYALKPGAKLADAEPEPGDQDPGGGGEGGGGEATDPFDANTWTPLAKTTNTNVPGLALAPEGTLFTEALRFKTKRLLFAQVMAHRLADCAPAAARVFGEGGATAQGGWNIARDAQHSISALNPARMALVWPTSVALRGVCFVNPSTATMAVDYWVGAENADPAAALADDAHWKEAGVLRQEIFTGQYFAQKATLRSCDFGEIISTRAVRLRVLSQEVLDGKNTAGFQALLALRSLGNDSDKIPSVLSERITEFQLPGDDGKNMQLVREIPFPKPGALQLGPDGALYALSNGGVATVPLAEGEHSRVVVPKTALDAPSVITLDADGLLYVADNGPKQIKVFDSKTGKLVKTLLKAGGQHVGPWDPQRVDNVTGLAVDGAGKLWVVDNSFQPKRVMRMTRDGQVEKTFLGPTRYGGGGWLDEKDKRTLIYNGMQFKIDWATHSWALDSILFRPGDPHSIYAANPERILYCKGKRYVVGEPIDSAAQGPQNIAVICREENGIAIPLAAAGRLSAWQDVETNPELRKAFGDLNRDQISFVWSDLHGDGKVHAEDVQLMDGVVLRSFGLNSHVGEDLAFIFGVPYQTGIRLKPVEIRPDGVPVYDVKKLERLPLVLQNNWETEDGRCLVVWDRLLAPDGKSEIWNYEDKYAVFAGFYVSGWGYDRPAGKLNAEQTVFGHFTLPNAQGKTEEYFVTNSDQGDWFVFTGDGVLLGCVFGGPTGYGKRQWTMPQWEPGKVDLTDLRLGQEHYQGCVVRADDGKVYAVCGHNHVSIVRIDGLEQVQRLSGALQVSEHDLAAVREWEIRKAAIEQLQAEPKIAKMIFTHGITPDGSLDEWPDELFFNIHDYIKHSLTEWTPTVHSNAALACDEQNLYVAAHVYAKSSLHNSAADAKLLFKGGDALDIWLGLDPAADPARKTPAPGDVRILVAMFNGTPTAEIFRYNVPGADPAKGQIYKSPVGETDIDEVETLTDAVVTLHKNDVGWDAKVTLPWKALRAKPLKIGDKIRADVGVLLGDENGMRTVERRYWSGKSQTVISDTPSEARIAPSLWGDVVVMEAENTMRFGPEDANP